MSPTFAELDALSSHELHDRAVRRARENRDAAFFWQVMEAIPEARAAAEGARAGQGDIMHAFPMWIADFLRGGGKLDDGLRPLYIEYLQRG